MDRPSQRVMCLVGGALTRLTERRFGKLHSIVLLVIQVNPLRSGKVHYTILGMGASLKLL